MTDQEINIAIAKHLGVIRWTHLDGKVYPDTKNYCGDLNAMHEAEKDIGLHNEDFTGRKLKRIWSAKIASSDPRFATARQRAEAFLRTING